MKRLILLVSLSILLFTACERRIDATSEDLMKISIAEIEASLEEPKKTEFQKSLKTILQHKTEYEKFLMDAGMKMTFADIKKKIHGKSVDEIIADARSLRVEITKSKKLAAKDEIFALYQLQIDAEKDSAQLSKFKVLRSRFFKQDKGGYQVAPEPIIEIKVLNGIKEAVSSVYFTGTLYSSGRSVPWVKDDLIYQIPGGLEPGRRLDIYLTPHILSEWGTVNAPKNARLRIEVKRLDDAFGNPLYSIFEFGDKERKRLAELLKAYPEYR